MKAEENMKKPSRILVPVDFSEPSLAALDAALLLGEHLQARLTAFSVVEPFYVENAYMVPSPDAGETETRLREVLEHRAGKAGIARSRWEASVAEGMVVDAILEKAREDGSDLIVMGTHGRRGLARAVLGSVTEQVIRRASCPVLAVRAGMPSLPERGETLKGGSHEP